MKSKSIFLSSNIVLILFSTFFSVNTLLANVPGRQFYQLIIYHIENKLQEQRVDKYLSEAYLPAVHRMGIKGVGIFKTYHIDTAAEKRIYVLLAFNSLKELNEAGTKLNTDKQLLASGADYIDAAYDNAPYTRKEAVIMYAFAGMPGLKQPVFDSPKEERVYQLRSYESATEKLYLNKVSMFNKEEIEIFDRIGSQPVFYGEVIAGSRMPNLMYLTTYSNMKSRDEHWKTFGSDPKWKRISALPEYQHNMKTADIKFLTPASYSDF